MYRYQDRPKYAVAIRGFSRGDPVRMKVWSYSEALALRQDIYSWLRKVRDAAAKGDSAAIALESMSRNIKWCIRTNSKCAYIEPECRIHDRFDLDIREREQE